MKHEPYMDFTINRNGFKFRSIFKSILIDMALWGVGLKICMEQRYPSSESNCKGSDLAGPMQVSFITLVRYMYDGSRVFIARRRRLLHTSLKQSRIYSVNIQYVVYNMS